MRSAILIALFLAGCDEGPLFTMDAGDSGVPYDGSIRLDAGEPEEDASSSIDAEPTDGAGPDAGAAPDALPVDGGESCMLDQLGPADRDRVVVVGQPFTATPGVDGTEIRSLTLTTSGALVDDGTRLDVGFRPARIEFSLDGSFALVLGENGELASVRVIDAQTMTLIDTVALPLAGYGDLRVWQDGQTIFGVGENVDTSSGINTINLACDGTLTVRAQEFFNIRLSDSLAFLPDPTRAILLGGQTAFDPIDQDELRLVEYTPGVGWTQIEAFDIIADFVDAARIAISPDGSTVVVPNGSPFSNDGNQASIIAINGTTLMETGRLLNLEDAREALFSTDGRTALITLLTPGAVAVLTDQGAGLVEVDRLTGIGLAENMAAVTRGALTDLVLVTSTDGNGEPNVALVQITGAGIATVVDMTNLGADSINIPVGIALQP